MSTTDASKKPSSTPMPNDVFEKLIESAKRVEETRLQKEMWQNLALALTPIIDPQTGEPLTPDTAAQSGALPFPESSPTRS